jgi:hypothetical protein
MPDSQMAGFHQGGEYQGGQFLGSDKLKTPA